METATSNHCQDIMIRLNNDRKTSAKYCDITLVVDDHKFPAHKSVLGLLSTFFDKMFYIDMKEKRENEAEINGVSKEVLEVILDFIYTGDMALSMENVFAVIEAAHFMDLPYVQETCTKYLGSQVNADNWLSIRAYAKLYDYKDLLDKVDEALELKFDAIIRSDQFVELDVKELKHLLGLQSRKVNSEDEVYKAVIGWIKHDVTGHEKYSGELLNFINFQKLTLDFLKQDVANEKLIETSLICTRAVLNAITNHSSVSNLPIKSFIAVNGQSVLKYDTGIVEKCVLSCNHRGGSAVKYDGSVFVISGFGTRKIEEVDINYMEVKDSGLSRRYAYAGASIIQSKKLYITGGFNEETSGDVYSWNEIDQAWKLHASDKVDLNRRGHALVHTIGSIYVVGGDTDISQSLLCYHPRTGRIQVLPPMRYKRSGVAAVVSNEQLYAIGGSFGRESSSCTVEKFHLLRNSWKSATRLNVARFRPGACVIKNQIVVVGGGSGKIEVYDEENNKWNIVGECDDLKDVFAIFPC